MSAAPATITTAGLPATSSLDEARRRRTLAGPTPMVAAPAMPTAAAAASPAAAGVAELRHATLPARAVTAGASVTIGGIMLPIVGALAGALLLGLPGALIGGIGGYLLARG